MPVAGGETVLHDGMEHHSRNFGIQLNRVLGADANARGGTSIVKDDSPVLAATCVVRCCRWKRKGTHLPLRNISSCTACGAIPRMLPYGTIQ